QPSGVGDSIADEVRIEGDVFRAFIASIAKDARLLSDGTIPPHPVMAAYVRPVLATSIVMLERAGLRVALPVADESRMQARDLEAWMVDRRDRWGRGAWLAVRVRSAFANTRPDERVPAAVL